MFRFDLKELQKALESAVTRGVKVHALIAHTTGGGGKAAAQARAGSARGRRHRLAHRRRPRALSQQDAAHRSRDPVHAGFNFTRLDIEKSRSMGVATKNKRDRRRGHQAVRGRFDASALHRQLRLLSREPRERAHGAREVHQEREERAADLRHEDQRSADDQAAAGARQGRRRRAHHRQGEQEGRGPESGEVAGHAAASRAPCCGTGRTCSSAA